MVNVSVLKHGRMMRGLTRSMKSPLRNRKHPSQRSFYGCSSLTDSSGALNPHRWEAVAVGAAASAKQHERFALAPPSGSILPLFGAAVCAAAVGLSTGCEEHQEANPEAVVFPKETATNRDDLMEHDAEHDQKEEPQVMAASMMQAELPALPGAASSSTGAPMFTVQRQRRLNGWAALEAKEDLKKVQLAQLLNDLHKMTQELRPDAAQEEEADEDNSFESEEDKGGLIFDASKGTSQEQILYLLEQLQKGESFQKRNFVRLIDEGTEYCRRDATLVDLSHKELVYVVGDLHGSQDNLDEVLKIVGDLTDDSKAVVFNGDFVDRGKRGVEVVCTLVLLKMAYPENVVLVRGNHEDALLTTIYGFEEEVREKFGGKHMKDVWASLSKFFASLPMACKTPHAAIMHGGIPSEDFSLDTIGKITTEERSKFSSLMEEDENSTEVYTLLRDLMWSDPMVDNGFHSNENRGMGKMFGTDVVAKFLEKHDMHYLIRSHEVMDHGWDVIDCGGNKFCLTVFSTSAYPDGLGENKGAILRLDNETGKVDPLEWILEPKGEDVVDETSALVTSTVTVIMDNKAKLSDAFEKIQSSDGSVTVDQWAELMEKELKMQMDWHSLQAKLAPTKLEEVGDELKSTNKIDWREFLELHTFNGPDMGVDDSTMESLFSNHDMLLTVFRYLDTDGNGMLDQEEFVSGITLLNERLPEERRFSDPVALFKTLDFDGSGEIDLDEFAAAFNVVSKPPDKAVLTTIFNTLDADGSGSVDLEEFRAGVASLNKKLPRDRQVKDADALFKSLDINGDGEIDIEEFNSFYF